MRCERYVTCEAAREIVQARTISNDAGHSVSQLSQSVCHVAVAQLIASATMKHRLSPAGRRADVVVVVVGMRRRRLSLAISCR